MALPGSTCKIPAQISANANANIKYLQMQMRRAVASGMWQVASPPPLALEARGLEPRG